MAQIWVIMYNEYISAVEYQLKFIDISYKSSIDLILIQDILISLSLLPITPSRLIAIDKANKEFSSKYKIKNINDIKLVSIGKVSARKLFTDDRWYEWSTRWDIDSSDKILQIADICLNIHENMFAKMDLSSSYLLNKRSYNDYMVAAKEKDDIFTGYINQINEILAS